MCSQQGYIQSLLGTQQDNVDKGTKDTMGGGQHMLYKVIVGVEKGSVKGCGCG